jgi:photosynthetic reaction center H subunit
MRDGVGTASYANRQDVPDLCFDDQKPKIVPLRVAPAYHIPGADPDPRGFELFGADSKKAGTVVDIWVDRAEMMIRYYEAEVDAEDGTKRVLFPALLANIFTRRRAVQVNAILSTQFADAPALRNPDEITFLEEDKVSGYFVGGYLYATPKRADALL